MKIVKHWLWLVPAFILAVLIFTNLTVVAAPFPRTCRTCHESAYRGWADSPHKTVACNSCHQEPGVLGQASQRLRLVSMVGGALAGEKNPAAQVGQETCLVCHDNVRRGLVRSAGLIMSHKEVIAAGLPCADCHAKAAHGPRRRYRTTGMDKCLKCHVEQAADTSCSTCHIGNPRFRQSKEPTPWRTAHGPKTRANHGLLDQQICSVCHTPQYCARCHGVRDLPHGSGWLNLHGAEAKRSPDDCLSCHRQSLCDKCHRVEMPHPADWLPKHAATAKARGFKLCQSCHMTRGCNDCHERHLHPVKVGSAENFGKVGRRWGGIQ